MPPTKRIKISSYIDTEDDIQLRAIEAASGILRSEQIRRGIKLWIRSRPKSERLAALTAKRS